MKYKVGDLVLVKDIRFLRLHPNLPPHMSQRIARIRCRPTLLPHPRFYNTLGIITKVEKHSDIFEKDSIENDNGYIWYSQVDGKEYYFYEDEVDCEVIS
ncbi:MAG: hypothetical protein EBZ58_09915 [Bacteroidetes bacterium]|nr:hypothetical protein [Bacteroidota bacterium]